MKRFWDKVDIKGPEECWEWGACKNPAGYGVFRGKENRLAHRTSYAATHGKIPKNLLVCHNCDNPACVNPNHLFLGAHQDNMADKKAKGRGKTPDTAGEKNGRVRLREVDVVNIRAIYRYTKATHKKLGEIHSVSESAIFSIINRVTWKHI